MFRLELIDQNPEKVYELGDPLSMGTMRVVIAGVEVWSEGAHLSSSALRLLRTVDSDFGGPVNDRVSPNALILHNCGYLPFGECPIGVSWRVAHKSNEMCIDRVMRAREIGHDKFVSEIAEPVIVAYADYAREVRAFASAVRDGIRSDKTRLVDDPSQTGFAEVFEKFWAEYETLLLV